MEGFCCKMVGMNAPNDPFPASEFDDWAGTYDNSIAIDQFPFYGYLKVLAKIVAAAKPHPGNSVLDLGTGTGNLAILFATLGCELWCTDFSAPMLEQARQKLPAAHFVLHDLRCSWPAELDRPYDCIVSAYVFHHFKLDEKIRILGDLLPRLTSSGRFVIGDIAFPDATAREKVKIATGSEWDEEFYWLADEAISAVEKLGVKVEFTQVSICAGIFCIVGATH